MSKEEKETSCFEEGIITEAKNPPPTKPQKTEKAGYNPPKGERPEKPHIPPKAPPPKKEEE